MACTWYHPKKRDGNESKKWSTGVILFSHCPFCGTEYGPIERGTENE